MAFWGSKTLLSAVEPGLFTELAKNPAAVAELQSLLKLHRHNARDFLDALVAQIYRLRAPAPIPRIAGMRGCARELKDIKDYEIARRA